MKDVFELVSKYSPQGDQPEAIRRLWKGLIGKKISNIARGDWNGEDIYHVKCD